MGQDMSVSSLVDELHAIPPEERRVALENVLQRRRNEFESFTREAFQLEPDRKRKKARSRPTNLEQLPLPSKTEQHHQVTQDDISCWTSDVSKFWNSSHRDFKSGLSQLSLMYDMSFKLEEALRRDCLRARYLKLFFHDYLSLRYPKRERLFAEHYKELAEQVSRSTTSGHNIDFIATEIERMAKAGRRYSKLVARFGSGILLTLPSNVSTYALEYRLPLYNEDAFEAWSKPIAESTWAQYAKVYKVEDLGRKIRETILSPFRGVIENQNTLDQYDGRSKEHATCRRRSSNIETSKSVREDKTEDAATTALIQTQKVSGKDTSTEEPAIPRIDPTTRSQETSDADLNLILCSNQSSSGKPGPDSEARNETDEMPLLDSLTHETLWYDYIYPIPIDNDLFDAVSVLEKHSN